MTNIVLRDLFVRQYQSLSPKTFFLSRQNGTPSFFSGSGFFFSFTKDFQLLLGGEDTLYVTIELNHHRKWENNEIIVWRILCLLHQVRAGLFFCFRFSHKQRASTWKFCRARDVNKKYANNMKNEPQYEPLSWKFSQGFLWHLPDLLTFIWN